MMASLHKTFSKLQFWVDTWIILLTFTYFLQSSHGSQREIPYDVALPPEGDGESLPPVIMLHSLLDWRKTWKNIAPEIAKNTGRKVYAYDALNHGESEWTDTFNMNATILDLEQFFEQHSISKAILVGHSLGGKTAMIYAAKKPEKVEKIVVEDMIASRPNTKIENFFKQLFVISKTALSEFSTANDELTAKATVLQFLDRVFTEEEIKALDRDFMMEWVPITRRGDTFDWLANLDLFIKMGNTQKPDDWDLDIPGEFTGDALFIDGTNSVFNVSTDELIPKHFPQATFVKFDANHFVHLPFGKEFEREVSDFINKKSTS